MEYALLQAVFLPLLLSPLAYIIGRRVGHTAATWFTFGLLLYCTILVITASIDAAKKSGDFSNLSDGDISTIALSLQLGAELITDDFAVSNVAKNLNIKVIPVMTDGIKNVVTWKYYCPGCKTNFSKITECPRCGNKLKRKAIKR